MADILRREPRILNAAGTKPAHPGQTYPVVKCPCGAEVHCDNGWSNECHDCGTEFNGYGQTLAPRSHWGEETGENFV